VKRRTRFRLPHCVLPHLHNASPTQPAASRIRARAERRIIAPALRA
jgi:hypothetical protein